MDNEPQEQPAQDQRGVSPDLIAHHENAAGATSSDVEDIAALFHQVGSALHTVDHQNVGGESAKKALQLDETAVFGDLLKQSTPHPTAPKNIVVPPEAVSSNPFTPTTSGTVKAQQPAPLPIPQPSPEPQRKPAPPPPPIDVDNIEKRLARLERAVKTFRNAKKIKKGNTYTVSSNSLKGELKDAELIAEFVMSELAKGIKTITIKLNDSKHS